MDLQRVLEAVALLPLAVALFRTTLRARSRQQRWPIFRNALLTSGTLLLLSPLMTGLLFAVTGMGYSTPFQVVAVYALMGIGLMFAALVCGITQHWKSMPPAGALRLRGDREEQGLGS
ncbi:hypothetical protein [Microbispora sp. NPDC046933]|uniref:hypothetical protein n=1 Tax=Microbispora sp. NPDC046933 TaxID=3155618 RepID=UPI0033FF5082